MKRTFQFLLCLLVLTSCVPNKKLIYLQGEPINDKEIRRMNNTPYKLQVGDIISVNIKSINTELVKLFNEGSNIGGNTQQTATAAFFSGYSVDRHGNIRLPYMGEVNVLGYTTVEVREKVEKELWKLFKNKNDVFVTVRLSGIRYTIIGEVTNPGTKVIYQNQASIIDAIADAGDITLVGDRTKVEVIRYSNLQKKKYVVDLTKIDAFKSEVFYIKPNDIINVRALKQKSLGTGTTGLQTLTTVISIFSLITSTIILARNL